MSSDDKRYEFCDAIEYELSQNNKHNKRTVEKLAESFGIFNKNLTKEMTELAVVRLARKIASNESISTEERYQQIVELYHNQVNLSHRTSQSMMFQQYSTPAPISYVASLFVLKNTDSMYFEPSAGNGLLTIALPYDSTTVNELDDVRLENLRSQSFVNVMNQDATIPFTKYRHYFDGVVTNPPFGSLLKSEDYDSFPISTLDHLMALRALDCMKNDGRAAIIIGGHTNWDKEGRVQAGKNRLFFNYLYSHYNVVDVILIDGHKLYSRQGTSFDVRLILIDGRKETPFGAAPLRTDIASEVVADFDTLWSRIFGFHKENRGFDFLKIKIKMKAQAITINKALSGYNKVPKLSAYTIADNCSDLNDIDFGIEEIREGIRRRDLMGLRIPLFYWNRLYKLKQKRLQMKETQSFNGVQEMGEFGLIYRQFERQAKKAIKYLMKVKQGEAVKALYRSDIGYIDIVWGVNDPKTNKGFGLKHIIEKHGDEIKALGFKIEDFIPFCIITGVFNKSRSDGDKKVFETRSFRFVVAIQKNKKQWLLTAFDLIKKPG